MTLRLDTTRNYPQIEALVARAEQHLRERDAPGLMQDLQDLVPCTIYSGNEAYERWNAIRDKVVLCLYEELPFERFLELPLSGSLADYEVFNVLDRHATLEQAMQLADRFGKLPSDGSRLFGLIASEPGEEVTRWCIAWAERCIATEETWASPGAATPLLLVLGRGDELAWEKLEAWMKAPPWNQAPGPTQALLRSRSPRLLEKAWQNPNLPVEARLLAMGYLPHPIRRAMSELLTTSDARTRDRILLWLDSRPWPGESPPENLEKADLRSWSFAERGLLDMLLRKHAPDWPRPRSAGLAGRLSVGVIRLFERIRPPMMGCLFFSCLVMGLFAGYNFLLDLALGRPSMAGYRLSIGALGLLLVVLGVTARPDFAASEESLTSRFSMGLLLFATLAAALVAPVLGRL